MIDLYVDKVEIYYNRSNAGKRQWSIGFPDGAEIEVGEITLDRVWAQSKYDPNAEGDVPKAAFVLHGVYLSIDLVSSTVTISQGS